MRSVAKAKKASKGNRGLCEKQADSCSVGVQWMASSALPISCLVSNQQPLC